VDGGNISLGCKRSESNGHFGSPCAVGGAGSGSAVDFSPSTGSSCRLICYLVLILSEGQSGEAWEPSDAVTFGNRESLNGESTFILPYKNLGTAVAQWLRYCATNQKVAGSIPDGVVGIFD
jgi:hypothetical protein